MRRSSSVLWLFLLGISLSHQASANIVENGDFQTGDFTDWTQNPSPLNFSFVAATPIDAGGLTPDSDLSAWLGPPGATESLSQDLTTDPGTQYVLTYDLRHEPFGTGATNLFQVLWDGNTLSGGGDPNCSGTNLGSFLFTQCTFSGLTGAPGETSTELQFNFREDTDYFQLTDVSVTPVPLPGALPLLGFGLTFLFGLGSRRRKRTNIPSACACVSIALVTLAGSGAAHAQPPQITDFTPEGIQTYLKNNAGVDSSAKFLTALGPTFTNDWIMMSDSESAQNGTAQKPRFILPNSTDASVIFGFDLTTNVVEEIQFNSTKNIFRFSEIDLTPGTGGTISIDDAGCLGCHASGRKNVQNAGPRPNWDAYDSWAGALPFNRDRVYQFTTVGGNNEASAELKAIQRIFQALQKDPIFSQLMLPNGITQAANGAVTVAFAPCNAGVSGPQPCQTDTGGPGPVAIMYDTDANANFVYGNTAAGAPTLGPINVTQGGQYLRMQATSKGAATDEGRGVALFDNLSALNAKRIATEITGFPANPVDIRYVALAIANNCITAATLGKYAPKAALNKLLQNTFPAAQPDFPTLMKDTQTRMQSLPQTKANLESQNMVNLITANGDMATAERVTANLARRSTEGGKYNLDMNNTGFMIDRELYNTVLTLSLYRLYLEPLGVGVDSWSMGVLSRSQTYTFADVFATVYTPVLQAQIKASLQADGVTDFTCGGLAAGSVKQYLNY